MTLGSFTAGDLFEWLTKREDFLLLDVRNDVEFGRFKVEGPYPIDMINVPYFEFIEMEEDSVARVPQGKKVRIVCAKEGSSKYVGEILVNHGFEDVAHMKVGIKAWGNLLEPVRVGAGDGYELYQFRRPGKASCSYGLISGKEMMVFDPAKNIPFYRDFARDKGCAIVKTFETHRQADYISRQRHAAADRRCGNRGTGRRFRAREIPIYPRPAWRTPWLQRRRSRGGNHPYAGPHPGQHLLPRRRQIPHHRRYGLYPVHRSPRPRRYGPGLVPDAV